MASKDFLSKLDDFDMDYNDYDVDDILNEEEIDDLEFSEKDPLKGDVALNRKATLFSNDSLANIQEDKQRLEMLLKLEKPVSKRNEKVDPLDLLHEKELQETRSTDKEFKTSLRDKRMFQESKLPVIQFEELKHVSFKIAPPSNFKNSRPTALGVSPHFILVGNSVGQAIVFAHTGQELKTFKAKKNFGQVVSLDITDDESVAALGYHFGQVAIWEIKSGRCIRACNTLHTTPVLSVKFWAGTMDHLITGELCGKVMLIEYGKSLMSTSISSSELFYDQVGSILTIERLVPDPKWPHPTDSSRIIAIAGTRKIELLVVSNEILPIYSIERPNFVSECMNPCISWGRAVCPGENEAVDHVLAVGWGEKIILYKIKFALKEGVQEAGYFDTDNEIKSIFWLSYEILFVMGKSRDIRILSSKEMYSFKKNTYDISKKIILADTYASRDIASHTYIKREGKEVFTYYSTIKCYERSAMILGNKDFQVGKLLNWKECIEELKNKNEWLEVLALGIDLYQGKGKKLYGIPRNKQEIRGILEENIRKYVKISSIAWVHKISNSIEFCIGIDSLNLLFYELFDIFIDEGGPENMKILMDTLEPFILNREIQSIPTNTLGKIIGYYLNIKRPEVLEKIILNLEPSCIDPRYILPLFEDHDLLSAYIFINTCSEFKNFVYPLDKIFSTALKSNLKKTEKMYLLYKLLWYFRLCIRGEYFPSGKISEHLLPRVITDVSIWIIQRERIEVLLKNDSNTCLSTLWLLFVEKPAYDVILKEESDSLSFQKIINSFLFNTEITSFLYYQIAHFILKSVDLDYVFLSKDLYMQIALYMMEEHRFSKASPIYSTSIDEYIYNFSYRTDINQDFTELTVEEKGTLLLKSLKKCGELTKDEIKKLKKKAEFSPYTEAMVYLLELEKQYATCVSYFVNCQSQVVKKKVFTWLDEIFQKVSEDDKEILKKEVMNFLNAFVDIDSDLTAKIVKDWYQGRHIDVVRRLGNAPKLQMKYLGELAKGTLDEDLVFRYVELLCENNPSGVLAFLSSREDYSIEDCLKKCLDCQVIEAAAYLHEKLGNIHDALELLLKRVKENQKILSECVNQRKIIPKETFELIYEDIKKCIDLCLRNNSRLDITESEELWFQSLDVVLTFYNDFKNYFSFNPVFEPKIQELIRQILEHMMVFVDFDKIISFITEKYEKIQFKYFKHNIFQVLAQHSYQQNIVKQATSLLLSDIKGLTKTVYNYKNKGIIIQHSCGHCKVSLLADTINKEKIMIFTCGHSFHAKCLRDKHCSICFETKKKKGGLVFNSNKKINK